MKGLILRDGAFESVYVETKLSTTCRCGNAARRSPSDICPDKPTNKKGP